MKTLNLILVFCFTALVGMAQTDLPDITIATLDGEKKNIQEYADNGKITVISFWATWCSPCKKELDNIALMYEDWQEDYNVEIVAITIDNARALTKVKPMVNAKGWEYEILSDKNGDLKRALNFQEVPFTFVVDMEGKIVYRHSGYVEGDEYELEDKLKELAGGVVKEEKVKVKGKKTKKEKK